MESIRLFAFRFATVFFGLLVGLSSSVFAESVIHAASGIVFPDALGAFKRVSAQNFEPKYPGMGSAYGYRSSVGTMATVYVFTAGISPIPSTVDEPVMAKLREQTNSEIRQHAQSRGALVQHRLKGMIPVKIKNGSEVRVLFDGFEFLYGDGNNEDSQVWLWPARGHIVKIRMTRNLSPEQTLEFARSVIALAQ